MSHNFVDRSGERRGLLVLIEPRQIELSSGRKMPGWLARCDCGAEKIVHTVNWTKDKHRSCGCNKGALRRAATGEGLATDNRRMYSLYMQMYQRCHMPTAHNYKWYGARGIEVCDRWRNGDGLRTGFECFFADMGERPEGKSLDRIDNDGPYSPGNCRWATKAEQRANTRPGRGWPLNGPTVPRYDGKTVREWAAEWNITHGGAKYRLIKAGLYGAILVAACLIGSGATESHSFYSDRCCNSLDCSPALKTEYDPQLPGGEWITTPLGRVWAPYSATPTFGQDRILPSPDGQTHACILNGKLICVYRAPGT